MVEKSIESVVRANTRAKAADHRGGRRQPRRHMDLHRARHATPSRPGPACASTQSEEGRAGRRVPPRAGEIVVTIDSDSVIERGALLAMQAVATRGWAQWPEGRRLQPFDDCCRGCCTSASHCRSISSQRQSTHGTVYAARSVAGYRTSVVGEALERWENQRFSVSRAPTARTARSPISFWPRDMTRCTKNRGGDTVVPDTTSSSQDVFALGPQLR